jgi:uncharacterized HAD superfamily protein/hypoxanthine phosphoribosyltransferase
MNYRSVADLNDTIMRNFHRLPNDVDLVVGIPRSGLLPANLLGLIANIPVTDIDRFIEGKTYGFGSTKQWAGLQSDPALRRRVLVIDDSIDTGTSMRDARQKIRERVGGDTPILFAAVYGTRDCHEEVDLVLETVPQPRIFQWNLLHHKILNQSCVDIDGVLCVDPTDEQNDDGSAYEQFLSNAIPLLRVTQKVGYLVTSRLEKYRRHTEDWLSANRVEYGELIMLDLPSAKERRRLGVHASFKADFYKSSDATLFIESEPLQAVDIARRSAKPVFCIETQHMLHPDKLSAAYFGQSVRTLSQKVQRANQKGGYKAVVKKAAVRLLGGSS